LNYCIHCCNTVIHFFGCKAIRDKKMPIAFELFEEIHTKKEGTEKVFCDTRAKSVWVSICYCISYICKTIISMNIENFLFHCWGNVLVVCAYCYPSLFWWGGSSIPKRVVELTFNRYFLYFWKAFVILGGCFKYLLWLFCFWKTFLIFL